MLLNNATVGQLSSRLVVPRYARAALQPGIIHLGLGAFSRAHLLAYNELLLNQQHQADLRWGVLGVSLRSALVQQQLAPQDHLYTLATLAERPSFQVIGCLIDSLVAPQHPQALLQKLAAPTTRIVSLTITEKGYYRSPANGGLLGEHPDIQHDLEQEHSPRTAVGFICRALALRRRQGLAAFSVLACDNLPHNGSSLRALVLEFAQQLDRDLADWIMQNASFPSTMVDRITPATTAENRQLLLQECGLEDRFPVVTEPFSQWVVEDCFVAERPRWEDVGVTFCHDVAPFERMKLALLNGTHSTMAYAGYPAGLDTVGACMAQPQMSRLIEAMMREEIAPTLTLPPSVDLVHYQQQLLQRYRNPAIRHLTYQIAMDGSQKLPQRLLTTLAIRLQRGESFERIAFALASWINFLAGKRENGEGYHIQDPLAESLQQRLQQAGSEAKARVAAILAENRIFSAELAQQPLLAQRLTHWLELLQQRGPLAAIAAAAAL